MRRRELIDFEDSVGTALKQSAAVSRAIEERETERRLDAVTGKNVVSLRWLGGDEPIHVVRRKKEVP
jgi:hypothetical protein